VSSDTLKQSCEKRAQLNSYCFHAWCYCGMEVLVLKSVPRPVCAWSTGVSVELQQRGCGQHRLQERGPCHQPFLGQQWAHACNRIFQRRNGDLEYEPAEKGKFPSYSFNFFCGCYAALGFNVCYNWMLYLTPKPRGTFQHSRPFVLEGIKHECLSLLLLQVRTISGHAGRVDSLAWGASFTVASGGKTV